ncbi:MAG: beta-aspartyl-peptidase [Candidatus Aminicenantes bacterium]|nr:beta-aspartyl-peptidase [Candidatus Aminicenantes bacterium]
MALIIRGGTVVSPTSPGKRDVLLAGGRIEAVAEPGAIVCGGFEAAVIEADGKAVLPGFIDPHVHILGGGGEGGPATRAPEIAVEDIVASGVTTVIGCLGTDSVTRHMSSLLAKARALEIEGISTWCFCGSYEIPVKTVTGSVRGDLVLIDKIIGAGEIALSDHRSSQPSFEEFARLAAECRVGGMLGGKAGILHVHMGDGSRGLEYPRRLARETEIPITQIIPTHCNRNRRLLGEAFEYARSGGRIDLTAGTDPEQETDHDVSVETAIRLLLENGVPLERVTVSSDGNGSLPVFDSAGKLTGLTVASPHSLLKTFRSLVGRKILSLEQAARLFSGNPSSIYQLTAKGAIEPGRDADLLIFNKNNELTDVIARGRVLMAGGKLRVKGTFRP